MASIQETLTRKVGPLPVWAYGAIVVAGAWVWFYLKGGSGAAESEGSSTVGYPGMGLSDSNILDEAGDNSSGLSGSGNTIPSSNAPNSNQSWYQLSSSYLVGFGYEGVTVGNALTKYLTGEALTVVERALVSQAIARYGVPPEGVPPQSPAEVPQTPGPPGTPTPPRPSPSPVPRRVPVPVIGSSASSPGVPPVKRPGTGGRY